MQTQQRGSAWSIKLVFNCYKLFGYSFIYYLMYPVTFFYFLFATNVRTALKAYYAHLKQPFTPFVYYKHLRYFAICMVDRFISRIDAQSYTYEYTNKEALTSQLNEGCILLLSHYGGWATASNTPHVNNKVHIVMKEVLLSGIKDIENSLENKCENINIIDLNNGGIRATLEISTALQNNEIVAMMADRANDKKYHQYMPFLGKKAGFNKNPFQIAYKLDQPLILFFVIHKDIQHYKVVHLRIKLNQNLSQEEAITEGLTRYINALEDVLKEHPEQWFNFYNFWEKE